MTMITKSLFNKMKSPEIQLLSLAVYSGEIREVDNELCFCTVDVKSDRLTIDTYNLVFDLWKLYNNIITDEAIISFVLKYGMPFYESKNFTWNNDLLYFRINDFCEKINQFGMVFDSICNSNYRSDTPNNYKWDSRIIRPTNAVIIRKDYQETLNFIWSQSNFQIRPAINEEGNISIMMTTDEIFAISYYYLSLIISAQTSNIMNFAAKKEEPHLDRIYKKCQFPGCDWHFFGSPREKFCCAVVGGDPSHNSKNCYYHRNNEKINEKRKKSTSVQG